MMPPKLTLFTRHTLEALRAGTATSNPIADTLYKTFMLTGCFVLYANLQPRSILLWSRESLQARLQT